MSPPALDVAVLSHPGTTRESNEDHGGVIAEDGIPGLVVVADGVSSSEAGEVASRTAVETTLRIYREQPVTVAAAKRLQRAVQQANIAVHDLALVVPELRGMATTLTAVAVEGGLLHAAHVGDCRLYLARGDRLTQLSKDHTVAAERVRLHLMGKERGRNHPERSTLTRSVGRELIVAVDRITTPLLQDDVLLVCSDGLYNVLEDSELHDLLPGRAAMEACAALVETANARGTGDNLTAAVIRVLAVPDPPPPEGLGSRLMRRLGL
jgi:protein phosphatase